MKNQRGEHITHERGSGINKQQVIRAIEDYCVENPGAQFGSVEILRALGTRGNRMGNLVLETLLEMEEYGLLKSAGHGLFELTMPAKEAEGTVTLQRGGGAIVRLSDRVEVQVRAADTKRALNGDRVRVRYSYNANTNSYHGSVKELVQRNAHPYVGTIQLSREAAFLIPDSRSMPHDIYISHSLLHGAKHGEKVLVRIVDWPAHADSPEGEVIQILGDAGVHEVEMHAILAEYNLPYSYPQEVTRAAELLDGSIGEKELEGRMDFRSVETFTIDPATAKDYDDALSYRALPDGGAEVGIHIADVTHYVRPEDTIDQEAYERATSVYLVDRTVPMLPERLCNDLCSLRPDVDRLSVSVIVELSAEAKVENIRMGRSVIHSQTRFSYPEVLAIIEGQDNPHASAIRHLHSLAQKLRAERFAKGAIDFASEDFQFELDAQGKPLAVVPVENDVSHQLIEEFMLLANRSVAEFLGKRKPGDTPLPFVFRIHDRPDQEKLDSLFSILGQLGLPFPGDTTHVTGKDITKIIHTVKGKPSQHMIDILAVRAMAKAIYSVDNIGHYGLAFDYYTHFTSPIRRYPDILAHRILLAHLEGKKNIVSRAQLEEYCLHCSEMEKVAADAERASIKYKQVEYMAHFIDQEFEGIISGVAEFGFFVELEETHCEGMVSMRELQDDYYHYIEDEFTIRGQRTGREYRLGDRVRIRVIRANLQGRFLDFAPVETANSADSTPRGGGNYRRAPLIISDGGRRGSNKRKGRDSSRGRRSDAKSRSGKRRRR